MLHIPLIHALSLVVWKLRDGNAHSAWFVTAPHVEVLPQQRWSLTLLFAVFAATIVMLYPLCRRYVGFKAAHAKSILRFL